MRRWSGTRSCRSRSGSSTPFCRFDMVWWGWPTPDASSSRVRALPSGTQGTAAASGWESSPRESTSSSLPRSRPPWCIRTRGPRSISSPALGCDGNGASTTATPATDLGYLLAKNPARLHTFDLAFGRALRELRSSYRNLHAQRYGAATMRTTMSYNHAARRTRRARWLRTKMRSTRGFRETVITTHDEKRRPIHANLFLGSSRDGRLRPPECERPRDCGGREP